MVRGGMIPAEHDLDAVKSVFTRLGVNRQGWRLLLSFGEYLFLPFWGTLLNERRPLAAIENMGIYLRLVQQCEMDVPPSPAFAQAWATMTYPEDDNDGLLDVPAGFFRAAWMESVRRQYCGNDEARFLQEELPLVVSWFFQTR